MPSITVVHHGWHRSLNSLVAGARGRLTIAVPFITESGVGMINSALSSEFRDQGSLSVITDLSPAHVRDGSMEPNAVKNLLEAVPNSGLWHVPRLHAKIYVADQERAIVTSGNLTAGAFFRNVEHGLDILDSALIATIDQDLTDTKFLGVPIQLQQLAEYARVAHEVRETYQRQQSTVEPILKQAFVQAVQAAEDELVRFRLAGGAMHTVFARTVIHLLKKHGPLRTKDIHLFVRDIHPDLCDDSVDRVIDGKHFGKKWKHAVRTAQQQDKRLGLIRNEGDLWYANKV